MSPCHATGARRRRALARLLALLLAATLLAPAMADAWSGEEIAGYAVRLERAWVRLTDADGRVQDLLEPA